LMIISPRARFISTIFILNDSDCPLEKLSELLVLWQSYKIVLNSLVLKSML